MKYWTVKENKEVIGRENRVTDVMSRYVSGDGVQNNCARDFFAWM